MKRIAIIDDERKARDELFDMINDYGKARGVGFDVRFFESATDFLTDYRPEYDIVFLDVDMPLMDGMTAASMLRKLDSTVMLVFVTNMEQFAVKGYEVRAFDFIVKPLVRATFFRKFERMLGACRDARPRYVYVRTGRVDMRMDVSEILYIEVRGHNVTYHTDRGEILARDSLGAMEERFDGLPLVRCNSCYIVNLRYVDGVGKDSVTVAGTQLAVSRSRKKEFMRRLAEYVGTES